MGALGHWWNTAGSAGPRHAESCRALLSGAEGSGGASLLVLDLKEGSPANLATTSKQTNPKQENKQNPRMLIHSEFQVNNA